MRGAGLAFTTPEEEPEDDPVEPADCSVGAITTLAKTVGSVKARLSVGGTVMGGIAEPAFAAFERPCVVGNEIAPSEALGSLGRSRICAAAAETSTPPTIAVAVNAARTVSLLMTVESTGPLLAGRCGVVRSERDEVIGLGVGRRISDEIPIGT